MVTRLAFAAGTAVLPALSGCAKIEPVTGAVHGMMRSFFGGTGVVAPVQVHEHPPTGHGGLGDHAVLETDDPMTCP